MIITAELAHRDDRRDGDFIELLHRHREACVRQSRQASCPTVSRAISPATSRPAIARSRRQPTRRPGKLSVLAQPLARSRRTCHPKRSVLDQQRERIWVFIGELRQRTTGEAQRADAGVFALLVGGGHLPRCFCWNLRCVIPLCPCNIAGRFSGLLAMTARLLCSDRCATSARAETTGFGNAAVPGT